VNKNEKTTYGEPLPATAANVFDDGHIYVCTVLIGSSQNIGYNWDKCVSGLGGILRYMSKWTNDDQVAGGGRRRYCACKRGDGKGGLEAIYIDRGEKVGKGTRQGVVRKGDKGF